MTLTKSQILSWDTSVLTAIGIAWTALGAKIEDLFARYKHAVVAVNDGHWEGETADAAVGRAGSDERTAVAVVEHLNRAAKIATDGFHQVNAPLGRARQAIADTQAAGYTVREDLSVYKNGKSTEADEKAMLKWANTIKAEADATEAADKQVKTALNAARADLQIAFAAPTAPGAPPPAAPRTLVGSDSIDGGAGALPPTPGNSAGDPAAAHTPGDSAVGSLPWLLNQARNSGGATNAPPPPVAPQDVESFKAVARGMLASQGVPPDQIEARVNAALIQAQQPTSRYVAPTPHRQPAPGFGEGFGDAWRATEQGIQNLLGQGGPGAPGVLDSWAGLAKGAADTLTNPLGTAAAEVQHALNAPNPAYYLGEKAFDIGSAAATLPFAGEGAAVRAGLPAELLTEGGAPAALLRDWNPTGGIPWQEFESRFGTPESRQWPGNDGFPPGYIPQPAQLPEGTIIDRFGSEYGRYLAPDGAPFADRSLAPESVGGNYNRYMITGEPLPPGWQIVEGPVEPFYGQTPSPEATQYMITAPDGVRPTVWELVRLGILDEYGPPLGR